MAPPLAGQKYYIIISHSINGDLTFTHFIKWAMLNNPTDSDKQAPIYIVQFFANFSK